MNKNTWQRVKLGEIAEIQYGKSHKNLKNGIFLAYGSGGVVRKVDSYIYNQESVLIPRKGSLNNIFYTDKPFWVVDTMFYTIVDNSMIISKFLFYYLKTIDFNNLNVGSAVPSLTIQVLNELQLYIPPLETQHKIAEILSSFDDKIDLLHRQNKTLESLALTLFRHYFINNPKNPNAPCNSEDALTSPQYDNMDFSCHSEPALAGEESPKENTRDISHTLNMTKCINRDTSPMAQYDNANEKWEIGKLGDYVKIVYGKNLPTKNLLKQGYAVFGGNGKIGYFNKYLYEEPQVLISCRGEASGKVNISESKSFITNNSLVLERVKDQYITFEYLKYWCLSNNFSTYVSGSAQPQITIEGLYDADFLKPNLNIIREFSKIVLGFENKISHNMKEILNLESMRDIMLSKLLSGEVEV